MSFEKSAFVPNSIFVLIHVLFRELFLGFVCQVCFIFLLYLFRLSVLALQFFDIYLSDFTSHVFRVKLKDWRDLFEISMHFEQNCVIGGKFL